MSYDNMRVAGALVFIGGTQFLLGMLVSEAVYPGYNISRNYISDLGVGPAAQIFNSSVFLLGLMIIASAYSVHRCFGNRILTSLLVLTGVGAMGVGIFPEDSPLLHEIVSDIAFVFGGLLPIAACRLVRKPFTYFSAVMGLLSLSALVLLSAEYSFGLGQQFYLGLGPGGMERMIAYPMLLWDVAFGGYLMASPQQSAQTGPG
jgi:hypothetical membrane protein